MKKSIDFDINVYQKLPQLVLGFHGCEESVGMKIVSSCTEHIKPSKNSYDWLGNGAYFWLNDPLRAYQWACASKSIRNPFVIGAIIDLNYCLNLCEQESIQLLQKSHLDLLNALEADGKQLAENKKPDSGGFNLVRPLDCAVFEHLHEMLEEQGVYFDTVYGYFQEGSEAYLGAGIREKTHIQVCVRNEKCIKGYFLPRCLP